MFILISTQFYKQLGIFLYLQHVGHCLKPCKKPKWKNKKNKSEFNPLLISMSLANYKDSDQNLCVDDQEIQQEQ